jgi:hypothetical protein
VLRQGYKNHYCKVVYFKRFVKCGVRCFRCYNCRVFMNLIYSIITDKGEIDLLRGRGAFNYTYSSETVELLKRNFELEKEVC